MTGPVIDHIAYVKYVPYQAGHNSSRIRASLELSEQHGQTQVVSLNPR